MEEELKKLLKIEINIIYSSHTEKTVKTNTNAPNNNNKKNGSRPPHQQNKYNKKNNHNNRNKNNNNRNNNNFDDNESIARTEDKPENDPQKEKIKGKFECFFPSSFFQFFHSI